MAIYNTRPYLKVMTCDFKGLAARTFAFFVMWIPALSISREWATGTGAFRTLALPPDVPSGAHFVHLTADRMRSITTLFIE